MVEASKVVVLKCAFVDPENRWLFPWHFGHVGGQYGWIGLALVVVTISLLRRLTTYVVRRCFRDTLKMDLDYLSVCILAIFISSWLGWQGVHAALTMHDVEAKHRIRHPEPEDHVLFQTFALPGNDTISFFVGYLIDDFFSRKMSADIVIHHVCFIYYCAIGSGFGLFSFVGSIFMAGELSTPFLSIRDILIKSGRSGMLLDIVNVIFVATFFITRVCLWTYGVYWHLLPHLLENWHLMPKPTWLAGVQVLLTCAAPGLQYYWFYLMVVKAAKRMKKGSSKPKAP